MRLVGWQVVFAILGDGRFGVVVGRFGRWLRLVDEMDRRLNFGRAYLKPDDSFQQGALQMDK